MQFKKKKILLEKKKIDAEDSNSDSSVLVPWEKYNAPLVDEVVEVGLSIDRFVAA